MKIRLNLLGVIVLLSCLSWSAFTQVATLTPDKPKWGDTLTVIYNPELEGAKFSLNEEVYVVSFQYHAQAGSTSWAKMEKRQNVFESKIPVTKGLSFVVFYFITLSDWDKSAFLSTMIYNDAGVPAEGAYQRKIYYTEAQVADSLASEELALYPHNYSVYRDKWFMANITQKEKVDSVVRADMEMLAKQTVGDSVKYYYALSYGYLLLKQEEKSRSLIKKMIERFPTSPLTGYALDEYGYHAFAQQFEGEGPEEIKQLKRDYVASYTDTEYARNQIKYYAHQEDFPLESVEKICSPWMAEKPDHPIPYYSLAVAYLKHNKKLDEAAQLMDKAITLILQGKYRLYEDVSGGVTKMMLSGAYVNRAKIAMENNNYAAAIASLKAAQSLNDETNPKALLMEAKIWQELSHLPNAETAYYRAWQQGAVEAEDSLRAIYKQKYGNLEGFESYLKKLGGKSATASDERTQAIPFNVTSIEGKTLNLENLRGKIVVLNFWFIGCAPCRVEIPGLNELVAEFKDHDVVFIGFALDDETALKKFLKKTEFRYHIIPNSGEIAKKYRVSAYPTHIIIDKEGNIAARLSGGSKERHNDLRLIIARLMKG